MKVVTELEEWDEEEFVPEMTEFRAAVDRIKNRRDSILIKALYLLALRVHEIATKTSPSLMSLTKPLGQYIELSIHRGYRYNNKEIPIGLFKCPVLKRKPKSKKKKLVYKIVALPCDPVYEPWALDLLRWIKNNGKLGFDLTAIQINRIIKKHLSILDPKVHTHSLRHWRATHLVAYYNFDGWDLCAYMGWTYGSLHGKMNMPIGKSDIYVHLAWKRYFPKLLRPLNF